MKIFSCEQIKEIDRYTIENEPVSSSDLMERAAGKIFEWFTSRYSRSRSIIIFTGPGNNGGDGFALARMLAYAGYRADVYNVKISDRYSDDCLLNRKRLEQVSEMVIQDIENAGQLPQLSNEDIVIDAIFGSGLTRPVEGFALEVIRFINESGSFVISVDVPSGLFGEDNGNNNQDGIIKADITLSFQCPKLSFMFADCYKYTGEWNVLPIGLHPDAIRNLSTPYNYIDGGHVNRILRKRGKFDHKGTFGHGLLLAGSADKAGAAILAARAALRTGIGLLTCHTASKAAWVIQTSLPEAMIDPDKNETVISDFEHSGKYSAYGAGPGIGTSRETKAAIEKLIKGPKRALVLDADALNIIGENRELLKHLPEGSVLTPHKKEFERLTSNAGNDFERVRMQMSFSEEHKCVIVLKGAHSSVSLPDGRVFFNSTGNPGMATAGSGDVLTGIILSLLAQGYSPEDAATAGVYIHGLAGDIAAEKLPLESIMASDIIDNLGNAILRVKEMR